MKIEFSINGCEGGRHRRNSILEIRKHRGTGVFVVNSCRGRWLEHSIWGRGKGRGMGDSVGSTLEREVGER